MGKRLYVGNLPYSVSEQDLNEKFGAFGTVESASLITDRDTGRSKGFGFVEMSTDSEAQAAIEQINGTDYDGRPVTVNEAKPMKKRENRW
ncbi:MAG: RNA recognition motif domain-containing protein [Gammaproteobacteria bacterium]